MAGPCCAPADASNVDTSRLPRAFLISMGATLCSVLGSAVILANRKPSRKFLAFGLSFSSGVMIFLSLYEMLGNSSKAFKTAIGEKWGLMLSLFMFVAGIAVTHGLSIMVHYLQRKTGVNTCECESSDETDKTTLADEKGEKGCAPQEADGPIMTMQSAAMVGLALALHNLPEGFAMFFAAASDLKAGLPLAIALAIHKFPEGLAVALPVFAQTGSRIKAFLFGALSSLPLPMGAGIAWILLATTDNVKPSPLMHAVVFGFVGGMMLYVSFTELLPQSYKQNGPMAQAGVITGMLVIASSFVVFDLI